MKEGNGEKKKGKGMRGGKKGDGEKEKKSERGWGREKRQKRTK